MWIFTAKDLLIAYLVGGIMLTFLFLWVRRLVRIKIANYKEALRVKAMNHRIWREQTIANIKQKFRRK